MERLRALAVRAGHHLPSAARGKAWAHLLLGPVVFEDRAFVAWEQSLGGGGGDDLDALGPWVRDLQRDCDAGVCMCMWGGVHGLAGGEGGVARMGARIQELGLEIARPARARAGGRGCSACSPRARIFIWGTSHGFAVKECWNQEACHSYWLHCPLPPPDSLGSGGGGPPGRT